MVKSRAEIAFLGYTHPRQEHVEVIAVDLRSGHPNNLYCAFPMPKKEFFQANKRQLLGIFRQYQQALETFHS